MNVVDIAKQHSILSHKLSNNLYDGKPYGKHLSMVFNIGKRFKKLIPIDDRDDVFAAIWEHDTLEDCNVTYSNIKKITNSVVAEIVYACTNEKGRNRKEKNNDKYFNGIRNTKYATFVKLCDRIANVEYSIESNNGMLEMYKKEHEYFKNMLYTIEYEEMWQYLDSLFT